MTLGAKAAGVDVRFAVDFSEVNVRTHAENFPGVVTHCADVRNINFRTIAMACGLKRNEAVDVLFGGPPCQGFSSIGKRNSRDSRNDLIFEFVRMSKLLRPRYVVIENVSGLLHQQGQSHLRRLISKFDEIGYSQSDIRLLDASKFGVPQTRKRVFAVFHRRGEKAFVLPHSNGDIFTVRDALSDLPKRKLSADSFEVDEVLWDTSRLGSYSKRLNQVFSFLGKSKAKTNQIKLSGCLLTQHSPDVLSRMSALKPGQKDPISRARRLEWADFSHTLRAGTDKERGSFTAVRPIHPRLNRCITVREGARLQSFPDHFKFHPSRWHGFRQVGNSVPPLVAHSVFSEIVRLIR